MSKCLGRLIQGTKFEPSLKIQKKSFQKKSHYFYMKYILTFLLSAFIVFSAMAQPVNDDCTGIIHLGDAPICPAPATYSNANSSVTDIGMDNAPPCFSSVPQQDVWFSFVAVASIQDYTISVNGTGGNPINQPEIALYRGDCGFDELVILECSSAALGETEITLDISGLTPGITYFIRVNNYSGSANPEWGDFNLCVQEFVQTEFTVDQGGSDQCTGTLYDTGGPNGNYGNNENNVFSICLPNPSGCIVFTMSEYNLVINGDNLVFYDGPDVNSPVINDINTSSFLSNGFSNGAVCTQVVATSGCLTVQFSSNGFQTMEGFAGTWECTDDCPQVGQLDIAVNPGLAGIEDALQNPYFDIEVINVTCDDDAHGVFQEGDNTTLGMSDGLLLTTGSAADVANPASFHADNDLNLGGEPDLNFLNQIFGVPGGGNGTSDACFVEMDVTAKTDRIGFDYVFGSDEYEDNFSAFSDDLMAIFISGPGINGLPGLNNQENLTWVPGFNLVSLIQIQQVNAATNWEYFRNNTASESIVYNGLTSGLLGEPKTLYAGREVTPCETYRVKVAITDTDANDDSGLFVQASDLGYPSVRVDFNTGINYLVEGCTNTDSEIVISLPAALSTDFSPNVIVGGTATPILDYVVVIPPNPTIPAGTTEISFPITVINDGQMEGTETIELSLTGDFGCGTVVFSTILVEIKDELEVSIETAMDTVLVCDGIFTAELQSTGAANYSWTPANVFDNPNSANPTATISADQEVIVTGGLGTCSDSDTVFLKIVSPMVDIQPDGPLQICEGEMVSLEAVNNVGGAGLVWSPSVGLNSATDANVTAQPSFTTTYSATVEAAAGCTATDEIIINVEPFDFPAWTLTDSIICQNSSVQLAAGISNTTTNFEWTPTDGLDDATKPDAIATPDVTTTYTLTATSENSLCIETASFTITVLPADVDIVPDTIDLCIGDSTFLNAVTSTGGIGLTWFPLDSLTQIDAENVSVKPGVSTFYFATLEVGACTVYDSVFVRVDSLPQSTFIEAIPPKDMYCEGEVVSLISPNYELAFFEDIMFQWSPATGAISEDTLYNFAFNALTTTTYVREITNNACSTRDSIEIIVVPVANITITPDMPLVCPGESVQLNATADQQVEGWEWSPPNGLSCTECTDPVATPPTTITYQVQAEFMGCPSSAQVTVEVAPSPNYAFPDPATICPGESIILNDIVDPNANYTWSNEDGSLLSNDPQPSVSPAMTSTYLLSISNGNCPPVTDQITVIIQEDYELIVSDDLFECDSQSINLNNLFEITGQGVDSIVWTDENGNIVNTINTADYGVGTVNIFTLETFDEGDCFPKMDELTITVYPDFTMTVSNDVTINAGESITLNASADLDGVTFTWADTNRLRSHIRRRK